MKGRERGGKNIGVRCRWSTRSYPGRPDLGSLDSGSSLLRGSLAASSLLLMVEPCASGRRRSSLRGGGVKQKPGDEGATKKEKAAKTLILQIKRSVFPFLPPSFPANSFAEASVFLPVCCPAGAEGGGELLRLFPEQSRFFSPPACVVVRSSEQVAQSLGFSDSLGHTRPSLPPSIHPAFPPHTCQGSMEATSEV